MEEKKRGKKPRLWRGGVGILSIAFITYMWAKKDIVSLYSSMPREQVLPLLVTTVAVTLLKVTVIAGGLWLIKWIVGKIKNRDQ